MKPSRKVLWLATCLLSGCASMGSIEMSGDPAKIPPFKTYSIHDEQYSFESELSDEQRKQISKELRAAAVSALNSRGYREATDADVLVTLGAISRLTLDEEAQPGGRSGHLTPVDTSVLDAGQPTAVPESERLPAGVGREGDLIFYLLDPKTQKAIWRASASGTASSPSEALRRARSTYAEMIGRLPRAAQ